MRYRSYWGLIALILWCTEVPAQQRKNIELIDSLITNLLADVGNKIQASPGDTLFVVINGEEISYQNYLAVKIGNFFKDKQFVVLRNYDPSFSFDDLILIINNLKCTIEYSKPYSKKFLGRSFIKRDVALTMEGQVLKGKSGEIIATLNQTEKYQDEVLDTRLAELESSDYSFTLGQRWGYSNWSSLIEPIVTITVISVIIYLFYAHRN